MDKEETELMKTKQIVALVVAVILFILTGAVSVLTHTASDRIFNETVETFLTGDTSFDPPTEEYMAVVNIVGTIRAQSPDVFYDSDQYRHTTNMDYIDELMRDDHNRGILLYVDSPGGTVYESQEMYDKLMEYKEQTGRPIYAYMAHYGESGAYMVSMAADKIYVNKNTVTGSIGVILSGYDLTGLYEKLGIKNINIVSGDNKAATFNKTQMGIYQAQVDEYFNEFVKIVADGRDMKEKQVRKLADGRIYTARQAVKNGLVDKIATYEDAKEEISSAVGIDNYYSLSSGSDFWSALFAKTEKMISKSDSQVLKETAEELESGVFMYYAKL